MNKKTRNFFIIAAALVVITVLANLDSFTSKGGSSESDYSPSYKAGDMNDGISEHLDSSTLIYSNFKYGFSMNFPDSWTTDRGVSEHTIIRGGQADSAISFTINVIELEDMESGDISLWDLWDDKELGIEDSYRNMMPNLVNTSIYNYNSRKVFVSNNEAIEMKFNYSVKEVDIEFGMQTIFYSIYRLPFTYTIAIHIPEIYYDDQPSYYDHLINDFVMMQPESN